MSKRKIEREVGRKRLRKKIRGKDRKRGSGGETKRKRKMKRA